MKEIDKKPMKEYFNLKMVGIAELGMNLGHIVLKFGGRRPSPWPLRLFPVVRV